MDETPVWSNLVFDTTVDIAGTNTVTLKLTGSEKSRVFVRLAAKADGTKLLPIIVFKNAKRDVNAIHKEFKNCIIIASSTNAWMNTELTQVWVNKVLGSFSCRCRHLVWNSYEFHMEKSLLFPKGAQNKSKPQMSVGTNHLKC